MKQFIILFISLLVGSSLFAQEPGVVFTCPPRAGGGLGGLPQNLVQDGRLSEAHRFEVPSGLTYLRPQLYMDVPYEVVSHRINQKQLICNYGRKIIDPRGSQVLDFIYHLTYFTSPPNTRCTVLENFQFRCIPIFR